MSNKRLCQIGESRLIKDIVLPMFDAPDSFIGIGDDCAFVPASPLPNGVVWTTDPCPKPAITNLGEDRLYHWGYLTTIINLSDIAASGSVPLGLLVSVTADPNLSVEEFEDFFCGVRDAAKGHNCPLLGGNIKEDTRFTATGTALGTPAAQYPILRSGASPGDDLYICGSPGVFPAAVLIRLHGLTVAGQDEQIFESALTKPVARIKEAQFLAAYMTAATDCSDGVGAGFSLLARHSDVGISLDLEKISANDSVQRAASRVNIDSRKLSLLWGGWELVFTADAIHRERITEICLEKELPVRRIGLVSDERRGSVYDSSSEGRRTIYPFGNNQFDIEHPGINDLKRYFDYIDSKSLFIP